MLATLLRADVRVGTSTPKADPSGDYAWALFRRADKVQPGAYAQLDAKALKLTGGADSPKPPAGRGTYAWVMDQRQALFFAAVPVLPAPVFAPGGGHLQVEGFFIG